MPHILIRLLRLFLSRYFCSANLFVRARLSDKSWLGAYLSGLVLDRRRGYLRFTITFNSYALHSFLSGLFLCWCVPEMSTSCRDVREDFRNSYPSNPNAQLDPSLGQ